MSDLLNLDNRMTNDALWNDDQGLGMQPDTYAPREFDDDEWCEMMSKMLNKDH
jgi:hypothetical protein